MAVDIRDRLNRAARARGAQHCLIIGEVAQAHDGSLGLAHAFIDAIADAGADAVKFQTHIAAAESTPQEQWRIRFSPQDATRFDYWHRMEFTEAQWLGLKQHADDRDLAFLSSPFSLEAADLLERIGVPAWKVASGEVNNIPLLERLVASGKPLLISSGLSTWSDLDSAVSRARAADLPMAVLQCTTMYPCPPEEVGLNLIPVLRQRYACAVGLSDHSGTIFAGLAGAALGIEVLEVHVTLSREMFGPDLAASVTTGELAQLVRGVRFIERMRDHPVDKAAAAEAAAPLRQVFGKSLVARTDMPAGTVLGLEHLTTKKPGTGLPAAQLTSVLGRRLRRAVKADALLAEEDLDDRLA